jgi:uncharacterized protein
LIVPQLGLIAIVLAAGVVNGWTSLGFAMVAAAGFALAIDPKTAVLLLAVTTPFISSVQLLNHRRGAPGWRRLIPLAIGCFVGVPVGAALLGILDPDTIALLIGGLAVFFVLTSLAGRGPRIPTRWEPVTGPVAGLAAGLANGTVGVSGPVLGSYLIAIGTSPAAFGFTISALFFSMGLVRITTLVALDQLHMSLIGVGILLLVPALLGQQLGLKLQRLVSPERARQGALLVIGVAGISLIARGLHLVG